MGIRVLLIAVVAAVGGCATATVRKVPNKKDYTAEEWDQSAVDGMTGLRFYLARPYVAVHEAFPIQATSFLVDGVVSADGRHVLITADLSDAKFDALRHARMTDQLKNAIRTRHVFAGPPAPPAPPEAQGEEDGDASPPVAKPPTGRTSVSASTDLNAVGHFPLRRYFDLVYLPDFEEQYVIDPKGRFGGAKVKLQYGPGNVLMSLGVEIDNSALTQPLLDAYKDVLKVGSTALKTALGLPPTPGAAIPTAQGESLEGAGLHGVPATLKVHVVRYATPGLYPVLKASEFDEAADGADDSYLVPVYPYSRTAFHTFETVVVEHLLGDGTSPAAAAAAPNAPRGAGGGGLLQAMDDNDLRQKIGLLLRGAGLSLEDYDITAGALGAVRKIELKVKPAREGMDVAAAGANAKTALAAQYPGTEFQVTAAE